MGDALVRYGVGDIDDRWDRLVGRKEHWASINSENNHLSLTAKQARESSASSVSIYGNGSASGGVNSNGGKETHRKDAAAVSGATVLQLGALSSSTLDDISQYSTNTNEGESHTERTNYPAAGEAPLIPWFGGHTGTNQRQIFTVAATKTSVTAKTSNKPGVKNKQKPPDGGVSALISAPSQVLPPLPLYLLDTIRSLNGDGKINPASTKKTNTSTDKSNQNNIGTNVTIRKTTQKNNKQNNKQITFENQSKEHTNSRSAAQANITIDTSDSEDSST